VSTAEEKSISVAAAAVVLSPVMVVRRVAVAEGVVVVNARVKLRG